MVQPRGKLPGRVKPADEKLLAGRPRKEPPPDAAEVIRLAAAKGASMRGAAMALACNVEVLTRWLDEDPDLKTAFDEGRERERQTLHSVLYEAAMAGAVIPALFLLKARHGYQEGQQDGQANRVTINFTIPGAMPLDKFMVVENEPRTERISTAPFKRS
jgi:hypothetical protein